MWVFEIVDAQHNRISRLRVAQLTITLSRCDGRGNSKRENDGSSDALAHLFLDLRLLRFRRTSAATLLDARRFELVFIGAECAVDLYVVISGRHPLDVLFGVIGAAELFGGGPACAERLGHSTLTAARFGVRFVLTIDAELRERDHLQARQRDFVAASRTSSICARAQACYCRVDNPQSFLRAIE